MVMSTATRACSECHAAKVKCVKVEGNPRCKRCERLGLKCVEHVSRQGQGTRRRKKVKTKTVEQQQNVTMDEAFKIACALSTTTPKTLCTASGFGDPMNGGINGGGIMPFPITPMDCPSSICTGISSNSNSSNNNNNNNNNSNSSQPEQGICSGMKYLQLGQIEDNIIHGTLNNGLGRDHFGLNHIIRSWIGLAFSRRSFSLLGRACFIASKMKIPMDDLISNETPFAEATDSQPMDFLATDILLPRGERKTLGYPVDIREVPWELLESVQINPHRFDDSIRNRTIAIRWASHGITRYWTSPLFDRDYATTEEIGRVWEENKDDKETVDLFLEKSEKGKFAQNLFNIIFVNNKPHMPCFVTKDIYTVKKRNNETLEANIIQTIKLLDLDSSIHYCEIQYLDRRNEHYIPGHKEPRLNKRDFDDDCLDDVFDEPIIGDGIAFTDIPMTDEMEEFLKLLAGE